MDLIRVGVTSLTNNVSLLLAVDTASKLPFFSHSRRSKLREGLASYFSCAKPSGSRKRYDAMEKRNLVRLSSIICAETSAPP